jgi:hypothetical protein
MLVVKSLLLDPRQRFLRSMPVQRDAGADSPPPILHPNTVTRPGSPPNPAMCFWIQLKASL